jgi:hypothetical protein
LLGVNDLKCDGITEGVDEMAAVEANSAREVPWTDEIKFMEYP